MLAWFIGRSHEKVRDLCEKKSCEISSELEICWRPAVCFASCLSARRNVVKTSLACVKQEQGDLCYCSRKTALAWEFSISLPVSRVQHNSMENRVTEDATNRAECMAPSHGKHFICLGIYSFYTDATQIKNVTETEVLACVPTVEWLLISKAFRFKPLPPQLDIHASPVHPGKCVIRAWGEKRIPLYPQNSLLVNFTNPKYPPGLGIEQIPCLKISYTKASFAWLWEESSRANCGIDSESYCR